MTQPNFVFIITDQHRADWLGCAGHPVVKTPNIDALAARGTRFTDCFVASPVCMPNRASLMTGRMPSVHGLRHNGCVLPKRAHTFVDVLAAAGYHTASIGKSHLEPFLDTPPLRKPDPVKRRIEEAWQGDDHDYTLEQPARYGDAARFDFPTPYFGFQHVDMVTRHGDKCGGHYQQWFRDTCPDWEALSDPANELPHNYTCPQAYRTPVPEEAYPTTYVGTQAVSYLDSRAGQDDPFFAFVSFPDPHHPFNPPGKYWDMYSPDQFEVTLPFAAHQNPTPPMKFASQVWEAKGTPATPQTAFRADAQHIREAMALTAGMITMIDDQVGRIVETLKANGQYDNTVIVFTSDHGDYLGDFSLLLKASMPFDGITRVPLIWADPAGASGATYEGLTSTIDLAASILDRAGEAPYVGMQGRSFVGADGAHRDQVLVEHNDGGPRLGFETPARMRQVRTKDYALAMYQGLDWGELYDLRADPRQTHNLWASLDHQDVLRDMSLRLNHALIAQMDESPRATRLA